MASRKPSLAAPLPSPPWSPRPGRPAGGAGGGRGPAAQDSAGGVARPVAGKAVAALVGERPARQRPFVQTAGGVPEAGVRTQAADEGTFRQERQRRRPLRRQ